MKMMTILAIVILSLQPGKLQAAEVRVGSKAFSESIVLSEITTLLLKNEEISVIHERALGDAATFQALVRGDIDLYFEYTGTLRQSIFADRNLTSDQQLIEVLAEKNLSMSAPLGFENSYALGVTQETAQKYQLKTISDLKKHPELRFGFTESFLNRGDGWPALQQFYQLPQQDVAGMVHDLTYVALRDGNVDVIDLYTTDAEIVKYDLVSLEDDRDFFPPYEAICLFRKVLVERTPEVKTVIEKLEGAIDSKQMQQINARVKIDRLSETAAAAEFIQQEFGESVEYQQVTFWSKLFQRTKEHLFLVGIAMFFGTLIAIPLGVAAYLFPVWGRYILWAVSILQTVPSLALLALMVPILGIKSPPAIAALFCYAMLPIVRNTHAGLMGIPQAIRESAIGLGLPLRTRLTKIELPLAAPMIIAGIKTATVLSIGFATLGAFVGAGGYGEPILTGVRLQDTREILAGAVPAACLAIVCEFLFEACERRLVPAGRREQSDS